jgi:hypothetical protein
MVYYAARGLDTFWEAQTTGRNNADAEGTNWWTPTPDPSGDQEQGYLIETARSPVRESIDAVMMLEPNDGKPSKPGQPSNVRASVNGKQVDLQWRDNAYNESGFHIERGINGVYTKIGSVGANVTRFSDTGLTTVADVEYRVRAYNAQGESRGASTWVYSGWTEVNLTKPGDLSLYTSYQPCDLRWGRGEAKPDHVVLNDDSTHGQNVTIDVDVGGLCNGGTFYVYFLYQSKDNWYRLSYDNNPDAQAFKFEKCINGTTTTVGAPRVLTKTLPVQLSEHALHGIGYGSRLRAWRIQVTPGTLTFTTSMNALKEGGKRIVSTITLEASEKLSLDHGLIGLGSHIQCPVWENFRFTTGDTAGIVPAIAAQPLEQTVVVKRPVTFSVAGIGTAPLTYQWKRGTANVGANSPSLTLAVTQSADAGSYTCTISNKNGSVTSGAVALIVNPVVVPTITSQPVGAVVPLGDTARLAVTANGTAPLKYVWKRGTTVVGTDSEVLTITGVQAGDAGSYTCTVSNDGGSATSNSATLETVAALDPLIKPAALFNDGGGTYGGYPNTADKVYDGNTGTFYDAKTVSGSYTGIDVGAGKTATVTAIRYYARGGQMGRMIGGVFEGSNAQADGYVTLATVTSASDQTWTTVLVKGAAPYRYLRYRGPNNGSCNVAEIEFHGTGGAGR